MENVINIELMVKSETTSDADGSSEPTYQDDKFALYARYMFEVCGQVYSSTVFITYLFSAKLIFSTGVITINETKNISDVSKSDIEDAIEADLEIKTNKINGMNAVNMMLNNIFHNKDVPFKISDGRESQYEVIKWSE